MTIQNLTYFISAAKHLSFTKAAEECLIAQTAMSRQIALIEKELNVKLFYRTNKKVKLTPAGEAFYIEAQEINKRYRNAKFLARSIDLGFNETLNIGFGMFETRIVSEQIKPFSQQNPNVSIILNQYPYDVLVKNLVENKCDIVFCPKNRTTFLKGIDTVTVKSYERQIAVSKSNPISQKNEITSEDLNHQVFITPDEDSAMHPELFAILCKKVGIEPKRVIRVNTLASILAMVEAGFGFSIVPGYLKESMPYDISIIPLKLEGDKKIPHIAAALLTNNNKPVQAFMKMLRENVRDQE
ncbi:MAG: LysR family transcriptional regulator [Clostridiales bacterium]|nr:LysR family transcriptional regulator [Clostridiales bacterium]